MREAFTSHHLLMSLLLALMGERLYFYEWGGGTMKLTFVVLLIFVTLQSLVALRLRLLHN